MKTLFTLAVAALFVSGCGGGGDGPISEPNGVAEKPADLWDGITYHEDGSEHGTECLVTPGAEVLCADGDGQVIKGKLIDYSAETVSVRYDRTHQLGRKSGSMAEGSGTMECSYSAHDALECALDDEAESGQVMLFHRDESAGYPHSGCFIWRRATQPQAGAAWLDNDSVLPMLSIDSVGNVFGQAANTGCYWTGTIVNQFDLDPTIGNYNLFKVELLMEGCTNMDFASFNGKTFRGWAFLEDTELRIDTLVMTLTAKAPPEGLVAISGRYRRH